MIYFFYLPSCIKLPEKWRVSLFSSGSIHNFKRIHFETRLANSAIFSPHLYILKTHNHHNHDFAAISFQRSFVFYCSKMISSSILTHNFYFFFQETEKLTPATLLKKSLWQRSFPVNFVKFLRTAFLTEYLRWLLLNLVKDISQKI